MTFIIFKKKKKKSCRLPPRYKSISFNSILIFSPHSAKLPPTLLGGKCGCIVRKCTKWSEKGVREMFIRFVLIYCRFIKKKENVEDQKVFN
ncbi:hypothetical protein [Cryptosporidium hominis TU502]|uniref:hypothetical protein n=1 Tax=Cryptosporidium hominis (strain TU502) TaxID=353151 RepID=UPI0000452F53|nr:hypothetical protein [Cryptosporidium hominis TU502]